MLGSGYGAPAPQQRRGGGARTAVVAGGTLVGLAAVGVGGWFAWNAAFASGPQPSEALPASTIGYVSLDLDPSGEQKVEAIETLEKFPGFTDSTGVDADTDLREKIIETATASAGCDLSFADDIEPWLGNNFGLAGVDLGGSGDQAGGGLASVKPVFVIEVTDAAAAEDGLAALRDCATGGAAPDAAEDPAGGEGDASAAGQVGGWSIEGDWAVVAETQEIADQVRDAAADEPLSDDDDYQRWMDAAGDRGIISAYVAPEAGPLIGELSSAMSSFGMGGGLGEPSEADPALTSLFEDFEGAAVNVRFADGGVEVESASSVDFLGLDGIYETDRGDDVVATLPEDTAVAFGLGFEEGWFDQLTGYVDTASGGMFDVEEGLNALEQQTGLLFPEDAEALFGDSAAFALSGVIDPQAVEQDPTSLPAGIKIHGDTSAVTGVMDKILGNDALPAEVRDQLDYDTDDEYVAAGFSEDYRSQLLEDGGLGDTDDYQDVVTESEDASAVLYVNFDAGGWVDAFAETEPDDEAYGYLEPLRALGLSAWNDDDGTSHSVLKVTTDD